MAQSTFKGDLQVTPQDLMTSSSTQGTNLGALATTGDGRYYRYVSCDATTATVPGKLYQAQAETTAWEALSITTASGVVGSTALVTTSTITATVNQLAGGYVAVTATPGMGYMYKIKGNTAASGAVATIYLEDPVQVAITSSSYIDLILNKYNGVIISVGSTQNATPVGGCVFPIVAGQYGWLQVKGIGVCLADSGTVVVGDRLVPSVATAGAVGATANTSLSAVVGYGAAGVASADYGFVDWNIS